MNLLFWVHFTGIAVLHVKSARCCHQMLLNWFLVSTSIFKRRPQNGLALPMSDGIVDVTKSPHFLHSIGSVAYRRPGMMASLQCVRTRSHVFCARKMEKKKIKIIV